MSVWLLACSGLSVAAGLILFAWNGGGVIRPRRNHVIPPSQIAAPLAPDSGRRAPQLGRQALSAAAASHGLTTAELLQVAESGAAVNYENGIALMEQAKTREEFAEAYRLLQSAADAGHKDALSRVANMLEHGIGTRRDLAAAFSAYMSLALQGDAAAQLKVGRMLVAGDGTDVDYRTAAQWFRSAAEGGKSEGLLELGNLHANGRGFTQDYLRARDLYREAAALGNPDGLSAIALATLHGWGSDADSKLGISLLAEAADKGSASAALSLAQLLSRPDGPLGLEKGAALQWLQRAAELGHPEGQLLLGRQLATGAWSGAKDVAGSIEQFISAAKGGNNQAMLDLGKVLLKTEPSAESLNRVLEYATQAFSAGSDDAALLLAQLSLIGTRSQNVERSVREALNIAAEDSWRAAYAQQMLDLDVPYRDAIIQASVATQKDYINADLAQQKAKAGQSLPKAISTAAPVLPEGLRAQGFTGTVNVNFTIGANGRPRNIRILDADNPAISASVQTALRSWRFEPATKNGKPTPVRVTIPISFRPTD